MSRRFALIALTALAVPFLAACSFAPVYGPQASSVLELQFSEPKTRVEQIILADLEAVFGTRSTTAPLVTVTATTSTRAVGRVSTGSLFTAREASARATVVVTDPSNNDEKLFSDVFEAAATYETSGQQLADQAAQTDAEERAAHQVAQSIRLTLLAVLKRN